MPTNHPKNQNHFWALKHRTPSWTMGSMFSFRNLDFRSVSALMRCRALRHHQCHPRWSQPPSRSLHCIITLTSYLNHRCCHQLRLIFCHSVSRHYSHRMYTTPHHQLFFPTPLGMFLSHQSRGIWTWCGCNSHNRPLLALIPCLC